MRGTRNWSRTLASPPLKIFKLIKLTNNKQRFRPPPPGDTRNTRIRGKQFWIYVYRSSLLHLSRLELINYHHMCTHIYSSTSRSGDYINIEDKTTVYAKTSAQENS